MSTAAGIVPLVRVRAMKVVVVVGVCMQQQAGRPSAVLECFIIW